MKLAQGNKQKESPAIYLPLIPGKVGSEVFEVMAFLCSREVPPWNCKVILSESVSFLQIFNSKGKVQIWTYLMLVETL